jgi:RHS repeat-associated protein
VWEYSYDAVGNLIFQEDPLQRRMKHVYDGLNRLTESFSIDAVGAELSGTPHLTYTYGLNNHRLLTETDRLNHTTTYAYDRLNRLVSATDAEANRTTYTYDASGNMVRMIDPLDRRMAYDYDFLNRLTKEYYVDASGDELTESPHTRYAYDALGNLKSTTDRLSHVTGYNYDYLNRLVKETDANSAETDFTYDAFGNLKTLTDPEQNTTEWFYDDLDRVIQETNELNKSRYFQYDVASNLIEKIDRNNRKTTFVYDNLNRRTAEQWRDGSNNVTRTISFVFDAAGQLTQASDPAAAYEYDYDVAGRLETESQTITGLTPEIILARAYDTANRLSSLAATIGSTADFKNEYVYDDMNRLERITQAGQSGGNAVAEKRVDFAFNAASQFDSITRYASLDTSEFVATTSFGYDLAHRLTSLQHAQGMTALAGYDYTYDVGNRITSIDSLIDGLSEYTHGDTNQLTGAEHASQANEDYEYDDNGNRIMSGYVVGVNNRILSDGVHDYEYDDEGNMTAKETISTGERIEYEWDHRNRLIRVIFKDEFEDVVQIVEQSYDVFNRWVRSQVDADGDEDFDSERFFAYDGNQIAMEFDGNTAADLSHRNLWGPAVDQILADESVDSLLAEGDVLWPLTDHLGTTRDLAEYDSVENETTIASHRVFDSFGNLVYESDDGVTILFGFTARPFDIASGLQWNLHRWYISTLGVWMSEDPIGFGAMDPNLQRYVSNQPIATADPSGLVVTWLIKTAITLANGEATRSRILDEQIQNNRTNQAMADGTYADKFRSIQMQRSGELCEDMKGLAELGVEANAAILGGTFVRPSSIVTANSGQHIASRTDPSDFSASGSAGSAKVKPSVFKSNAYKAPLRYKLSIRDLDWRHNSKTFDDALSRAFELTGKDRSDFVVTKWGKDKCGKSFPVEWRSTDGAEVSVDWAHNDSSWKPGLPWNTGPDAPHVGWQTPGKRNSGGGARGHIILDEVPYNR